MTITEALKLSKTIRRSSWEREDFLVNFLHESPTMYPFLLPNNPKFPNFCIHILNDEVLGFSGLTANDWVALIYSEKPTDLEIGNGYYVRHDIERFNK